MNAFNATELDICECLEEKFLLIIGFSKFIFEKKEICLPVCAKEVGHNDCEYEKMWKGHGGIACIPTSRYSVSRFTGSEYTISCVCLFLSSAFINRLSVWSQCWSPTTLSATCKLVHESRTDGLLLLGIFKPLPLQTILQ